MDFCKEIKTKIENKDILPESESISMKCSNKSLLNALAISDISKEVKDTTEEYEIKDIVKQIENITGHNLITGQSKNIKCLVLKSPKIDGSTILQDNLEAVKQSYLEDLSNAYGISSDKINIISIVPGGFQLYFTISENLSI